MSEDKKRDRGTDKAKNWIVRHRFVLMALVVAVVCGSIVWKAVLLHFHSFDVQLAAIEAARAIPESENAGAAYIKLASEYLPIPHYPRVVNNKALVLTAKEPWQGKDYPKLAAWIDERQVLISKLIDISRMEKCRLPIPLNNRQRSYFTNPIRHMHGWTSLLVRSANKDVGEGRIDAAIEKYACILRMATHQRQQPTLGSYYSGAVRQDQYVALVRRLITQRALTDEQLLLIEAALLSVEDDWKMHLRLMLKVQSLIERRGRPKITDWRRYWDYRKRNNKANADALERTLRYHLRALANRREMHILIALHRFKNKTGNWPRNFDQIEPPLSKETLTDPRSDAPFVYEVTSEGFRLYSGSLTER